MANTAGSLSRRSATAAISSRFQEAAGIAGYFSVLPEADGTIRKVHLLTRYQGGLYESFSAATLRAAMGGEPLAAGVERQRFLFWSYRQPWLEVAGIRVNLNADGSAWVPYRAGAPFPYVSAKDVLAGRTDKAVLETEWCCSARPPRGSRTCA